MPDFFPISLDLRGRPCLVVGAGEVAARKAASLLDHGADVTVVAPEATEVIRELASEGRLRWHRRRYRSEDMEGAFLAIAATGDPEVNRRVYEDADRLKRPVNVVDVPELCSFIVPSILRRGSVSVAVSTSGKSPTLAKRLRRELEAVVGPEYGLLADLLGELRPQVHERVAAQEQRAAAWERAVGSGALGLLREGRVEEAREALVRCLLF